MTAVSEDIFRELDFFAVSFLLGIILVLAYDCLRICRRLFRHGPVWISLEDLCYWLIAGFIIFAMLYTKNEGLIRGFSMGGIAIGMLLYNQFISRYTVYYISLVFEKIMHLVTKICRIVFGPFCKWKKGVSARCAAAYGGVRKYIKFQKKRLKKTAKKIRIGVTKK